MKNFIARGNSSIIGKESTLTAKHKDGFEFKVIVRISHVISKGNNLFVALVSDQSIYEKIEQERKEYSVQLNGRIKTIMTVFQSIVKQTLVTANPEEVGSLLSRLFSIDKAINLLYQTNWERVNLYSLIYDITYIYGTHKRFVLKGDDKFELRGNAAISFALIIHELCTNSIKFGALQKDSPGKVYITWNIQNNSLIWNWHESGGPKVQAPEEIGFGIQFIKRAFTGQGTTIVEYLEDGLSCTLVLKLDSGKEPT